MMNSQIVSNRLVDFGARIGLLVDQLPNSRLGRHIAGQLVRSGTSPAPNYDEGCAGESRADFIHKLSVCLKELRESGVWLRMTRRADLLPVDAIWELSGECDQLMRIIGKSVATARRHQGRRRSRA